MSLFSAVNFPGQGSQEPGMGRDAAEAEVEVMALWKKAEAASRLPLREIYWDSEDAAAQADTRALQPALTVVNLSLWRPLSKRLTPAAVAGHSLGEYSALAAAGVLPEAAVIELVALRGRLMHEADPNGVGAMAAVLKLGPAEVEACVRKAGEATGEMIVAANYNTPGQTVISGTKAAVAKAQELVKEAKGRAVPLPVSGAFHSPLMQEAAGELAKAVDALGKGTWNKARFPVYANATGRPAVDAEAIRDRLKRQMTSSVHWVDTIRRQWDDGARLFVECGPKGVLTKMVEPILRDHAPAVAAHSESAPAWNAMGAGSLANIAALPL